jgi:anti-sigma regulatory factor (Ser/Thr protein kinase)
MAGITGGVGADGLTVEWAFWSTNTTAATAVRRALVTALRTLECDCDDVDAFELVYGELASNAARHAEPREVSVAFAWEGETGRLAIASSGVPFDFEPRPVVPEQEHGRGHYIVAALSDEFSVAHAFGVNTVCVRMTIRKRRAL